MAELTNQSHDPDVIEQAYREDRLLLTEDKDFGWHVFVSHAASTGIMLIRFPSQARSALAGFPATSRTCGATSLPRCLRTKAGCIP